MKSSPNNFYTITVGAGGSGAPNCTATGAVVAGNGAYLGEGGGNGGSSSLSYKDTVLFKANGGTGGRKAVGAGKMGAAGTGGTCENLDGYNSY